MAELLTIDEAQRLILERVRPLPAERVKLLRDAYWKMFSDPDLLEDMGKKGWEPQPVNGEELQRLAKEVVNQPPEVAAALKRILNQ